MTSTSPELLERKTYLVESQADSDINYQSSWCAAVFARHASTFKQLLGDKQIDEFVSLYNQSVREGSELRAARGTLPYGENIDHDDIQRVVGIRTLALYTIILNENSEFVGALPAELRDEFYTRTHSVQIASDYSECNFSFISNAPIMISRNCQSFAVIPLTSELFLLLDSSISRVGLIQKKSLLDYIFNIDGPIYATFVICEMMSETLPNIK
jgi:hypothetical protein